ncbi:hypothetical protein L484_002250 [Morus notabilis]|uniref:Uncharacterized protein n=1 Tax=Morus notabilis TaxID=981085 RepID=W9S6C9_9ROSA|nr:hypothetical protein L484_002250 [Morus notabilis]
MYWPFHTAPKKFTVVGSRQDLLCDRGCEFLEPIYDNGEGELERKGRVLRSSEDCDDREIEVVETGGAIFGEHDGREREKFARLEVQLPVIATVLGG